MGGPNLAGGLATDAAVWRVGETGSLLIENPSTIHDHRVVTVGSQPPVFAIAGEMTMPIRETIHVGGSNGDGSNGGGFGGDGSGGPGIRIPVVTSGAVVDLSGGSLNLPATSVTTTFDESGEFTTGETVDRQAVFGERLLLIRNRSGQPIAGHLAGLPQGAPTEIHNDVYHVDYEFQPGEASLGLRMTGPYPMTRPVRIVEGDIDRRSAEFDVQLDHATDRIVEIDYQINDLSARNTQDYTAVSGTLVFAPFQTEASVSVPILDDAIGEDTERFALSITAVREGTRPRLGIHHRRSG